MSLIGIDIGSSAVKVVAFAVDGTVLAQARREVPAYRPKPGYWEVDPRVSWGAAKSMLGAITTDPGLTQDPPTAISFSTSAREIFPVGADGTPLGPCLMTADVRGDDTAAATSARRSPDEWFALCGHVPRRMDGINRILWWQQSDPSTAAKARWFLGWHAFSALQLAGRPVIDACDAGSWLTYNRVNGNWAEELALETGVDPRLLPEIKAPGTKIGTILPEVAEELGLPTEVVIVTGAWDAFASTVGVGAIDQGIVGLACGSTVAFTLAASPTVTAAILEDGLTLLPHPGPTGFGVLAANPNGTSVVDWARNLVHMTVADLDAALSQLGPHPGYVWADSCFSPLADQQAGSGFGGTLNQLTLATTAVDIVRAVMESIACQLALTLSLVRQRGLAVDLIRAYGGGARSPWWIQTMADIFDVPIEVCSQVEQGAFGAALLAGVGSGLFSSVADAIGRGVKVARRHQPNAQRGELFSPLLERLDK